jgi:hypothetical protein
MVIAASTIAQYAPWGNAVLAFELATGTTSIDPETGNTIQATETREYLAALNLETPQWSGKPGSDETTYPCSGRLLTPSTLDSRITNGSQAAATVNGTRGRFELIFDLAQDAYHRGTLRQSLQGTFRVIGGP